MCGLLGPSRRRVRLNLNSELDLERRLVGGFVGISTLFGNAKFLNKLFSLLPQIMVK